MNDIQKKSGKEVIIFVVMILIMIMLGIFYVSQKVSYHEDELFTFGLSNSYEKPFLDYPNEEEGLILTGDDFKQYLYVTDDAFSYASVAHNQMSDVHPPLYYFCVHTLCSLFRQGTINQIGFAVNIIFGVLTMVVLWHWLKKEYPIELVYAIMISYGFSASFYSMTSYFRMYAMLTFFTVSLTASIFSLLEEKQHGISVYLTIGFVLCLGGLTHYYFFIFAFFIGLAFVISRLLMRQWKAAGAFVLTAISSAAIYCLLWGKTLYDHIFNTSRGHQSFRSVSDVSAYLGGLGYGPLFAKQLSSIKVLGILLFLLLIIELFVFIFCSIRGKVKRIDRQKMSLIIIPWIAYVCLIAIIAPFYKDRYIFNILPLAWITLWGLGYHLIIALGKKMPKWTLGIAFVLGISALLFGTPNYLYEETKEIVTYLDELPADTDCIYYIVNGWTSHVSVANTLANYDETYMVLEEDLPWLSEQKLSEQKESMLLLIEDEEALHSVEKASGFSSAERIGEYKYAYVYMLTK